MASPPRNERKLPPRDEGFRTGHRDHVQGLFVHACGQTVNSRLCEMFGIEVPIFAFSHCRDVVVEVSKAGGLGVLGMARMSAERVHEELAWIDANIDGKPYGIDILNP